MKISKEEMNQFDKVISEILLPIIEENEEDIEKIFKNNPEFKTRVENKLDEILKERKRRKEADALPFIEFETSNGEKIALQKSHVVNIIEGKEGCYIKTVYTGSGNEFYVKENFKEVLIKLNNQI